MKAQDLKVFAATGMAASLIAALVAGRAIADDPARKPQADPVKQREVTRESPAAERTEKQAESVPDKQESRPVKEPRPVKLEKAESVKADPVKEEKADPQQREKSQPVKVEESGDKQKPLPADKAEGTRTQLTDAQTSALAFAKANHPELAGLLAQLQASNPKGFQTAIEELTRAQERLLRIQERTPDRYESELALWKLDSRIRLLAAQSTMRDSDGTRTELRGLLQDRRELRLARLRDDQSRQQARLEKLNASIAELEAGGDAAVDAELEQLLTRAQNRAREVKPRKTSPAATQTTQDRKQP